MHRVSLQQHNGGQSYSGEANAGIPNKSQGVLICCLARYAIIPDLTGIGLLCSMQSYVAGLHLPHHIVQLCLLSLNMTVLLVGSASQQQTANPDGQSESDAAGFGEQAQQTQQFQDQQYSAADWAAYWQYYGKLSVLQDFLLWC